MTSTFLGTHAELLHAAGTATGDDRACALAHLLRVVDEHQDQVPPAVLAAAARAARVAAGTRRGTEPGA